MSRFKTIGLFVGIAIVCVLLFGQVKIYNGEGWNYCANNLGYIGGALLMYHKRHGHFPPAVVRDKDGNPLYSWRVLLLPYLASNDQYGQFHLDEPWDSPHNKQFLTETPREFSERYHGHEGTTFFQALVGPGTAFEHDGLTLDDFPRGVENTILVVEAAEAVPWTKPVDLVYDPEKPLPPLGGHFTKPVQFLGYTIKRTPGFVAVFGDGKARFIRAATDENIIRNLISTKSGEKVDLSALE